MGFLNRRHVWLAGALLGYALLVLAFSIARGAAASRNTTPPEVFGAAPFGPTYSSPIALSADKNQLWVVNPDDDSVSVLDISSANPANYVVLRKINVGDEPQSVALDSITPTSYNAYVANAASNSVTVINVNTASSFSATVEKEFITGAEPWNIVASPDGRRIFVANSGQDTITVIRTDNRSIVGSVDLRNSVCNDPDRSRHFQPRGMAVTEISDRLYVTRFLSFTGGSSPRQGTDTGKIGVVCQLAISSTLTDLPTVTRAIPLSPQITGFKDVNGNLTSAFPNQLQSIVIRGGQAYLPNIAASPSGPLKFNVNTQAFVNVIDGVNAPNTPADATATKFPGPNLHLGARLPEAGKSRLFFSNPWAIAFTTPSGAGKAYVVSAGSDLLVKLNVDSTGALTFTNGISTTRYIDLNAPANPITRGAGAGKNPLGIAIRNNGPGNNFAYVMNYISRNVSIVNLDSDQVARVIQTTELPDAGTIDEQLQVGKEIFFSARGVFNGGKTERLSSEGWQNCASCHFAGLTDGVIWTFNAGPRKSVPLNGTWSPHNRDDQRILNYSAIFDEVQDFELNIRNVSGPGPLSAGPPVVLDPNHGLLIGDTGDINVAPGVVNAFALPNAGRPQLSVTLPGSTVAWPALDAMKEWVRFAVRTPNGALVASELSQGASGGLDAEAVRRGRRLFFRAGCQTCHGGTKWTISTKDFTSPPGATTIFTEAGAANAVAAQFLDQFLEEIGSFGLGVPGVGRAIDGNIGAVEKATDGKDALGADHNGDGKGAGFNIPSLLGIFAVPPYYHNGACETLACVLTDVTHRTRGLRPGRPDPFVSAQNQADLVAFLQALDAETIFPTNLYINRHDIFVDPPRPFTGSSATVGVNVSLFGTRADLVDLLDGATLNVRFTGPGLNAVVPLTAANFNQDFGQATVTTSWSLPNTAGFKSITVQIDSANVLDEPNERDNSASRRVFVAAPPPDRVPPVVTAVTISDDDPFNPNDSITESRNVNVRFNVENTPSTGGAPTTALDSFCIVRYSYNSALRRWIEERCDFQELRDPDPGTDDTFTVEATIPPREGAVYAFVWVRDKAGNISRRPGFDVISFMPTNQDITLDRNEIRLFRITVNPGQPLAFTFTPTFGDIDVSAFEGFSANATRCAVSVKNGAQPETVVVGVGDCSGTNFQLEVRAVVNSSFRISITPLVAGLPQAAPAARELPTEPTVGGPPPAQAAIGEPQDIFVPIVSR